MPQILFAYELDGKGGGKALKGENVAKKIKSKTLAWVHLDVNAPETRHWLETQCDYLDPLVLDALLAHETRPRVMEYQGGMLLNLRGVNLNENAEAEDMVSIRIWIDPHRIISLQRRNLKAVKDLVNELEEGKGPSGPADFLAALSANLFLRMEKVLTDLDSRTDDIEEAVLDKPDTDEREEIIDIRRMAIVLRRYIAPQKDIMSHLCLSEIPWIEPIHKHKFQENLDRVTRYVEDLDAIRERAQIVKDELINALSDRLNRNMYVLSIVAAIFLPLGFITGLLGINVGGMPGANDPQAFWIVFGLCLMILILQLLLFRKMKWF
ncbi:MAG: zinc transporter ZntB [Alphaproteobacteria bacterium]|nr:zinc transporter ZntB [Alphaproteobacteria bacterium]